MQIQRNADTGRGLHWIEIDGSTIRLETRPVGPIAYGVGDPTCRAYSLSALETRPVGPIASAFFYLLFPANKERRQLWNIIVTCELL